MRFTDRLAVIRKALKEELGFELEFDDEKSRVAETSDEDPRRQLDETIERVAEEIKETPPRPVDTGGLRRLALGGSLGVPLALQRDLEDAGITHVDMIEIGGNGVYLPCEGWVSIAEIRRRAEEERNKWQ